MNPTTERKTMSLLLDIYGKRHTPERKQEILDRMQKENAVIEADMIMKGMN